LGWNIVVIDYPPTEAALMMELDTIFSLLDIAFWGSLLCWDLFFLWFGQCVYAVRWWGFHGNFRILINLVEQSVGNF